MKILFIEGDKWLDNHDQKFLDKLVKDGYAITVFTDCYERPTVLQLTLKELQPDIIAFRSTFTRTSKLPALFSIIHHLDAPMVLWSLAYTERLQALIPEDALPKVTIYDINTAAYVDEWPDYQWKKVFHQPLNTSNTMSEKDTQLALPYDILGKPLGRTAIRAAEAIKAGRQTFNVPFERMRIRDDYNIRSKPEWMSEEMWEDKLEIPQLATDLLAGKECPDIIKGDFVMGNDEMGEVVPVFVVSDGERRYRAIRLLIKQGHTEYQNGKPINMVEVLQNPINFTEFDRNRQFYSTNNNMKYTDTQWADLCYRMKTYFMKHKDDHSLILSPEEITEREESVDNFLPLSTEDIGKELGQSRQWVDNMLIVHKLPNSTKIAIDNGEIPYTKAVAQYRKENAVKPKPKKLDVVDQDSGEVVTTLNEGESFTPLTKEDTPFDNDGEDQDQEEEDNINQEPVFSGNHTVVETDAALDAEEESRRTRDTYREDRPKGDREDALMQRNFKTDKDTCDMNLNQVERWLDKLEVQIDNLPDHTPGMKQTKSDMTGLINGMIRKTLRETRELIKKAPDQGTIS